MKAVKAKAKQVVVIFVLLVAILVSQQPGTQCSRMQLKQGRRTAPLLKNLT
jgi:hypothetical protein